MPNSIGGHRAPERLRNVLLSGDIGEAPRAILTGESDMRHEAGRESLLVAPAATAVRSGAAKAEGE
jgi:hypothetical protein